MLFKMLTKILLCAFVAIALLVILLGKRSKQNKESGSKEHNANSKQTGSPLRVYFAGSLFSLQEVVGNELLARAIDVQSNHRYECILPQRSAVQEGHGDPETVRNSDLHAVLDSQVVLINANGVEIDSGVVAEKIYAHAANKPVVMLRTDFRHPEEKWNLMLSYYPRTEVVYIDAFNRSLELKNDVQAVVQEVAQTLIGAFDRVIVTPSNMTPQEDSVVQEWLSRLITLSGPGPG